MFRLPAEQSWGDIPFPLSENNDLFSEKIISKKFLYQFNYSSSTIPFLRLLGTTTTCLPMLFLHIHLERQKSNYARSNTTFLTSGQVFESPQAEREPKCQDRLETEPKCQDRLETEPCGQDRLETEPCGQARKKCSFGKNEVQQKLTLAKTRLAKIPQCFDVHTKNYNYMRRGGSSSPPRVFTI